jgi:hypothetical protein
VSTFSIGSRAKLKGPVEVLELKELWALSFTQQTEALEDGEGIVGGGTELLCRSARMSYRFKLVGKQHGATFLYDLETVFVDDEHD